MTGQGLGFLLLTVGAPTVNGNLGQGFHRSKRPSLLRMHLQQHPTRSKLVDAERSAMTQKRQQWQQLGQDVGIHAG